MCVIWADGGFDELWAAINKELSFLHLEMRRVNYVAKPGAPPVRFVGIVNRVRPHAGGKAQRAGHRLQRPARRNSRTVSLRRSAETRPERA